MGGSGLSFGILTSGGDCPGLNAAIRGVGKAALGMGAARVVGIAPEQAAANQHVIALV